MANILLGAMVSDIRGSVGGVTFSRGAGGQIARTRVKPVNPATAAQGQRRSLVAQFGDAWSSVLTQVYRDGWNDWAGGSTWTNKVGTSAIITGLAAFLRLNSLLMQAGKARRDPPPLQIGQAGSPSFTFTATHSDQKINIATPGDPFDKNIPANLLIFYMHAPTRVGRTSPSSARSYMGKLEGATPVPPTFPLALDAPWHFEVGQQISVVGIYIDVSFRVGTPFLHQIPAIT